MGDIKFKITEADIQKYFEKHRDDREIRYKEAMFMKYMKEQDRITKETLEILMEKYNQDSLPFSDCGLYSCLRNSLKVLPDFSSSLNVRNLDISGICYMLIPTLGLHQDYAAEDQYIKVSSTDINYIASALNVPQDNSIHSKLVDALENYQITGGIYKKDDSECPNLRFLVNVRLDKEHCRRELYGYESIYGEESVKEVENAIQKTIGFKKD